MRDRVSPSLTGSPELQATAALPPPLKLFHAVSPAEEAPAESAMVTVLGA
jgi:hypothetical protein